MTLSELSVRRPVMAVVAAILILVLGVASLLRLPVREYPDVDQPRVSVSIVYPGASARVVERDVTRVVEDNLNGIEAVELIDSTSRAGFSQITVEFALWRDLDAAAADVRDRVSAVAQQLPDETEAPVIRKAAADADAMMWLTLTSEERDRRALTDFAIRVMTDPLSIQSGVSQVIVGGARRYAMRVELDRDKLSARGVTVREVAETLRRENVEAPGGRIETDVREFTVRTDTKVLDATSFERLVVRESAEGEVRLGDVAEIRIGAEDYRSAVYRSGEPAVGLGIVRQSGANTIAVAERVRATIDALGPRIPPDIDVSVSYDQSIFIEGSIREVVKTLLITVGLVVAVVYLSLGSLRGTLVPAATIPSSAIGAFAVMYAFGFTINTLTLLALVLAIGLVVDDAIVVLENVTRRREQGESRLVAAVRGTAEVFTAVVATTAVLVAVLLPIAAMTGFVGRLFTEFAVTLATAVVFSTFLALTLGATLASKYADASPPNRVTRVVTGGLARAERGYARIVDRIVGAAWLVVVAVVALGAGGYLLLGSLPGKLAPTEDRAVFIVPLETPEGSTLAETRAAVRQVRDVLAPHAGPDGPIEETIAIVGTGNTGPAKVTEALVIVKLKLWGEREIAQQALVAQLVPKIVSIPGAEAIAVNLPSLDAGGFGKPIQVAIRGPTYEAAYGWAQEIRDRAEALGSMRAIELGFNRRSRQVSLEVDRLLAAELGIDAAGVGETLRLFLGGSDVTEFYRRGETYEVVVRGREEDRDDTADLGFLELRSDSGALVPLATVATPEVIGTSSQFRRVNRRPSVVFSAAPREGEDLAAILGELDRIAAEVMPAEGDLAYLGLSRDFQRSSSGILAVFAVALTVVYLTLAALFGSFLSPLCVMLAVPLAITTGLAALWAGGFSLNIFSQIGLLIAIGLLAKNAILLVDFANQRRAEGMERREAAREGARQRFRPIVMTSISTLFGAVPLVLATGPGSESRTVIGVTVMAGVAGATLITLFVVPGLYALLSRKAAVPGATSREVDRQLASGS